ncbi:MAG: 50S ribosomal protein L17 [Candidatus Altimarinota bacterium]
MRHRKTVAKLGRTKDHREAMIRNLATSLALEGKLTTTTPKAKALVSYYEHLISVAKRGDQVKAIRMLKQYLYTEPAQKAFAERLPELTKKSGNVRLTKVGFRDGDSAEMSLVEIV